MIKYINYMENEIWKDIPGYEGKYQVSNLGRVKGVDRYEDWRGTIRKRKGKIKSQNVDKNGYYRVNISKEGKRETIAVHILVSMAFLGHKPDGYNKIIDHKEEGDKSYNIPENLQIITQRENCSKKFDKSKTTSRYTGVYWRKDIKKWKSQIQINGKRKHLGYFNTQEEASKAYQQKLKELI